MRKAETRKYGHRLALIVTLFWTAGSAASAWADIYLNGASGNDGDGRLADDFGGHTRHVYRIGVRE